MVQEEGLSMRGWERDHLEDAVAGWRGREGGSRESMMMGERSVNKIFEKI
jgi:hypothetical protein